jgi:hypothetical protein
MKHITLTFSFLFLFLVSLVYAQEKGSWTTGSFGAGDTTETITITNAKIFYLVITDSAISGTDTLHLSWKVPTNTTAFQYSTFALHEMDQTTRTTDVSTALLIPGDATTQGYMYVPLVSDVTFSGTLYLRRLNTRTGEAVYAAVTRFAYKWE